MRNHLFIALFASLFVLPFVSLAQLRYAFDTLLTGIDLRFIPLLAMALIPIFFVYTHGKKINDELDQKYQLIGTKGGKSRKSRLANKKAEKSKS